MDKLYRVNVLYSILIIVVGITGLFARYLEQGDWQFTSLIPAGFGVILLMLTPGMKNHNRIAAHLVVLLTFLLTVMVAVMLIKNLNGGSGLSRKVVLFLIILAGSIVAMYFYIASFVKARTNKE